jgi:hypothetical protein
MLMFVSCRTTEGKNLPVSRAPLASKPPRSEESEVEVEGSAAAAEVDVVD